MAYESSQINPSDAFTLQRFAAMIGALAATLSDRALLRRWQLRVVPGPCRSGEGLGLWSRADRVAVTFFPPGVPVVVDDRVCRSGWRFATWTFKPGEVGLTPAGSPVSMETVDPRELAPLLATVSPGARDWFLRRLADQITSLHVMAISGEVRLESERDALVELYASLTRTAGPAELVADSQAVAPQTERRVRKKKVARERRRGSAFRVNS